MKRLMGAEVSAIIKQQVTETLKQLNGYIPTLAIIRVGENPDDLSYERGAKKKLEAFGLKTTSYTYPETISNEAFQTEFAQINNNTEIDGILLLRPLPKQIDETAIEALIDPSKDMDGISPVNVAKVFSGDKEGIAPCTASAVIEILDANHIQLEGKKVVIIGRSMVVGKPLSMLLLKKDATITICHSKTKDIETICKHAQILIAAIGKPKLIDESYISKGSIVIDVGINVDETMKLCGDVNLNSIDTIAAMATPVPGGVGTVTTAVLAKHLVEAAYHHHIK